ncbi:MAG: DUF4428 domain-containing protein [Collinsella sp.]
MGFFDKMFEKKECAICGTELGLVGKTKINEGYLCKECVGKLSPSLAAIAPAPRTISVSSSPTARPMLSVWHRSTPRARSLPGVPTSCSTRTQDC